MKILSICGSPRKGNSEALVLKIQKLLKKKGVENEVILLREKKVEPCRGCEEYCFNELKCCQKDDMGEIIKKMEKADGFVFASPDYFLMPSGLFKNLIDRSVIFYAGDKMKNISGKKAAVVVVGSDKPETHRNCLNCIGKYAEILGMTVVAKKAFQGNSDLKGNLNDIFENGYNPNLEKDLRELVEALIS